MTTALYRRYRPESFAEVIGQDHVTAPLRQALRSGQTNHAYLFSGPRGCGKTTSARILARCLNCAQGPTDTPCGVCASCVELARGGPGSLDVVEIDAASHGGVDDARELRERATFAPARDRYKIFILDEAHMVSPQGFNALLKIVEEPPPHVKFVFATTEPDKVIGTIRSRTHHYPFRLIPPDVLVPYLEQLCASEGIRVGAGVLPLVVRAGGGSARDTLSVLDQLIAGAGDEGLEYEGAVALLGYTHASLLDDLVEAVAARDGASAFRVVERVIATGHEPRRFVEDLLERLRDLIVIAASGDAAAAVLRDLPPDQMERMRAQAAHLGMSELSRSADLANSALTEMVGATSPRLHLELLMARLLLPAADDSRAGLGARIDRLERGLGPAGAPVAAAPPTGAPARQVPAAAPTGAAAHPAAPPAPVPAEHQGPAALGGPTRPVGPGAPHDPSRRSTSAPASGSAAGPGRAPAEAVPAAERDGDERAGDERAGDERAGDQQVRDEPVGDEVVVGQRPAGAPVQDRGGASPGADRAESSGEAGSAAVGTSAAPAAAGRGATAPAGSSEASSAIASTPAPVAPTAAAAPSAPPPGAPAPGAAAVAADTEMLRRRWPDVLTTLRRLRLPSWALVNQHAQVLELDATTLRLGFLQPGLVTTFRNSAHGEVVARALHETLGVGVRVEAVLHEPGAAPARPAAAAPAVPDVPAAISPERAAASWDLPPAPETGPAGVSTRPAAPGDEGGDARSRPSQVPTDEARPAPAEAPAPAGPAAPGGGGAGVADRPDAPQRRTPATSSDDDIPPGDEPDDPWAVPPPDEGPRHGGGPVRQAGGSARTTAGAPAAVGPSSTAATSPGRAAAGSGTSAPAPGAPTGSARERGMAAARAARSHVRAAEPDEPSPDDPTIASSGLVGAPLVMQVLGGRIIEEQVEGDGL